MTRSLTLVLTPDGFVFDRVGRCRNFACTAQRGAVCMLTRKGSDPVFPDAGTHLPDFPGTSVLSGESFLNQQLAGMKRDVTDTLRAHPTDYAYEGLDSIQLKSAPMYPDRLNLAVLFRSSENLNLGLIV
jgi:hypothetical protein